MKKVILILTISMLFACKKECNFPPAPYGTPNDVSEYTSAGHQIMVIYFKTKTNWLNIIKLLDEKL
jgi:hypothetical protein